MVVKSIKIVDVGADIDDRIQDHNIYIDTQIDSVFFSAVPIMDYRWPAHSVQYWKAGTDEEIANKVNLVAEEVQNYLNGFYDIFSKRVLNVEKHRLEIKKEYVIKAGLWVKKKRYAQWIISDNGVPVDKLDVKGIDVKRSSFPKAFQTIMQEVLVDILKGKPEVEITKNIKNFKKTMETLNVVDMAKNSSVKDISKHIPKGNRKIFETVKGTPAHVKAAIIYNDLLIHFNVPYKYQPMRGGDKIKWVYLKDNPLGIDGLAFTGYQDPPEIIKIIEQYTDHDKIFEHELHGKLQAFYDAIGWGQVLSQEKEASRFFDF